MTKLLDLAYCTVISFSHTFHAVGRPSIPPERGRDLFLPTAHRVWQPSEKERLKPWLRRRLVVVRPTRAEMKVSPRLRSSSSSGIFAALTFTADCWFVR